MKILKEEEEEEEENVIKLLILFTFISSENWFAWIVVELRFLGWVLW